MKDLICKALFDFLSQEPAIFTTPELLRADRNAMSLVRSHVSSALLPYLQGKQHDKEVWNALKDRRLCMPRSLFLKITRVW
jgi:hypothetical protein